MELSEKNLKTHNLTYCKAPFAFELENNYMEQSFLRSYQALI